MALDPKFQQHNTERVGVKREVLHRFLIQVGRVVRPAFSEWRGKRLCRAGGAPAPTWASWSRRWLLRRSFFPPFILPAVDWLGHPASRHGYLMKLSSWSCQQA